MSARLGCCYLVTAGGVGLLAAALCLPVDFGHAAGPPSRLPSDLAVLPGDCAVFCALRPADFCNDPLCRAIGDATGFHEEVERSLGSIGVKLADVELMTN